ncbi:MAG: TauD/TfdA family dioxygenase [Acidimicrobiia bacterium]
MSTHIGSSLAVRPLAGALGAAVDGVDLTRDLSDETVAELHALLDRYLVLFFAPPPGTDGVTDEQQHAFASRFGSPTPTRSGACTAAPPPTCGSSTSSTPSSTRPTRTSGTPTSSWDPDHPTYGTLRACATPSRGGDTIWASMYAAYESLSPTLRDRLDGLVAVHTMGSMQSFVDKAGAEVVARTLSVPGTEHPVVGVHPRTGRRYLNVNREFTSHVVELHADESRDAPRPALRTPNTPTSSSALVEGRRFRDLGRVGHAALRGGRLPAGDARHGQVAVSAPRVRRPRMPLPILRAEEEALRGEPAVVLTNGDLRAVFLPVSA